MNIDDEKKYWIVLLGLLIFFGNIGDIQKSPWPLYYGVGVLIGSIALAFIGVEFRYFVLPPSKEDDRAETSGKLPSQKINR